MALFKLLSKAQTVFSNKDLEEVNDLSRESSSPAASELQTKNTVYKSSDAGSSSSEIVKLKPNVGEGKNEKTLKNPDNRIIASQCTQREKKTSNEKQMSHFNNHFRDSCVVQNSISQPTDIDPWNFSNGILGNENKLSGSKHNFRTKVIPTAPLEEDFFQSQKSLEDKKNFVSFFTKKNGLFYCNICDWSSKQLNFDELNDHMNTDDHIEGLKNRFESNPIYYNKCVSNPSRDEKATDGGNFNNFTVNFEQDQNDLRQNNKTKSEEKSRKDNFNRRGLQHRENIMPNLKSQKLAMCSDKMQMFLKLAVFGCIQITPENEMKCTLCDSIISIHLNCEIFMRNVATHIQSKKHISNLSKKQKSLKLLEDDSSGWDSNNVEVKFQITEDTKKEVGDNTKRPQNVKKASKNSTCKDSDQTIKLNFFCTTCNFFGATVEVFSKHEQSQHHKLKVLAEIQSGAAHINDFDIKFFCKNCLRFIIGSQANKMKHASECRGS